MMPRKILQHCATISERSNHDARSSNTTEYFGGRVIFGRGIIKPPHTAPSKADNKIPATGTGGHVRYPNTTPKPRTALNTTIRTTTAREWLRDAADLCAVIFAGATLYHAAILVAALVRG